MMLVSEYGDEMSTSVLDVAACEVMLLCADSVCILQHFFNGV